MAGLKRQGPGARDLLDGLRDRGHTPRVKDCLDRCDPCEKELIALIDGIPVRQPTVDALLEMVDELDDEDDL